MCWLSLVLSLVLLAAPAHLFHTGINCGYYGFTCVGQRALRLCRRQNDFGPAFVCPQGKECAEKSLNVCERVARDPAAELCLRAGRAGRMHDPSAPNCIAYLVCIRRGAEFTAERLLCPPGTLFNGVTRTCTPLGHYRCPHPDAVLTTPTAREQEEETDRALRCADRRALFRGARRAAMHGRGERDGRRQHVGYSCPPRAAPGAPLRCTVYTDLFCTVLERDEHDHFSLKLAAMDSRAWPAHARTRTTTPNINTTTPHTHNPTPHTHTLTPHTTHPQTQTHHSLTENTVIQSKGPVRTLFLTI